MASLNRQAMAIPGVCGAKVGEAGMRVESPDVAMGAETIFLQKGRLWWVLGEGLRKGDSN